MADLDAHPGDAHQGALRFERRRLGRRSGVDVRDRNAELQRSPLARSVVAAGRSESEAALRGQCGSRSKLAAGARDAGFEGRQRADFRAIPAGADREPGDAGARRGVQPGRARLQLYRRSVAAAGTSDRISPPDRKRRPAENRQRLEQRRRNLGDDSNLRPARVYRGSVGQGGWLRFVPLRRRRSRVAFQQSARCSLGESRDQGLAGFRRRHESICGVGRRHADRDQPRRPRTGDRVHVHDRAALERRVRSNARQRGARRLSNRRSDSRGVGAHWSHDFPGRQRPQAQRLERQPVHSVPTGDQDALACRRRALRLRCAAAPFGIVVACGSPQGHEERSGDDRSAAGGARQDGSARLRGCRHGRQTERAIHRVRATDEPRRVRAGLSRLGAGSRQSSHRRLAGRRREHRDLPLANRREDEEHARAGRDRDDRCERDRDRRGSRLRKLRGQREGRKPGAQLGRDRASRRRLELRPHRRRQRHLRGRRLRRLVGRHPRRSRNDLLDRDLYQPGRPDSSPRSATS